MSANEDVRTAIAEGRTSLGIEFGSTRIKACLVGEDPTEVLAVGSHEWENRFVDRVWTYSLEDVWSGPRAEGFRSDIYIKWRVEGTDGLAQGTIGWPDYPSGSPSTLRYNSRRATGGEWVEPRWETMWFPHAFKGVMAQLQDALRDGREPELSGRDNVKTMALVEAGYHSIEEGRSVKLAELGH